MLRLNRLALRQFLVCAVALAAVLALLPHREGQAQGQGQAQEQGQAKEEPVVSRGENFSAKPAPALFASDCTGGDCHKSAQGLAKGQSQTSLAGFLREHYTNSRESAAALAAYLLKLPNEPARSEARTSRPRAGARASGVSARQEEAPSAKPSAKPPARPQTSSRGQHTRQSAASPPIPPEPAAVAAPAPPPPPKKFDIFD